jgi:hypothetical protein
MYNKFAAQLFIACLLITANISCTEKETEEPGSTSGKLTGLVKKSDGTPLNNVTIIVDNSILFNSNVNTKTNAEGRYAVDVPIGSWFAFAQHKVRYNDLEYTLYLKPDKEPGFGREGGIRNFTWVLTGTMPQPLSGTFGGLVTFDNFPGEFVENEREILWKFEPVGNLIDGSAGPTIITESADSDTVKDLPIGRYRVSASYEGQPLKLRRWNTDEPFANSYVFDFQPVIDAQCHNCFKLEYRK